LATIDGKADDILVDTGTDIPATLSTIDGKVDVIDGIVDDILSDTGTDGVALTEGAVDDILDEIVEGTYSLRELVRLIVSTTVAKCSGAATATNVFRDISDTKDRVTATVDSDGNRTAVSVDES
jgi:hypothetical protein